ncbi:MAG: sigma-70 family RNA polymerase sigma factor [Planctomyces sp.]|jgi:RNA polymerase sigma-70 factor (ECF subfamily)|nr:sigma-70 family RNA polymerase sigma factor [Planctomyces sp.]
MTMSASGTPDLGDIFWNEIADRLRFFIRSRIEDSHTADDLVQDVILKAQLNLHSAPMHKLSAWMFQIARNVIIDHYRSRKHRRAAQLDDETPIEESETVIVSELSGCIRPMLARLPDASREALEQTDLGELTQIELAKQLGLSVPGVKSRVQRAREQLRTVLVSCCAPKTGSDGSVVSHGCDCLPPDYCSKKSGKC